MGKSLQDLANEFGTDKAWHQYPPFYQAYLHENPKRILEIGIHKGGSLEMWQGYYPNAEVIGADFDTNRLYNTDKIKSYFVDQENKESLKFLIGQLGNFDIIVDDGGHTMKQQQYSLAELLSFCKYYVLEDLHTSLYPPDKNYGTRKGDHTTLSSLMMLAQGYTHGQAFPHLTNSEVDEIKKQVASIKIFYNGHDKDLSVTAIITTTNVF